MTAAAHVLERVWLVFVLLMGPLNALATRRRMRALDALRGESAAGALRALRGRAYRMTATGLLNLGVLTLLVDAFGSRNGLHALLRLAAWPALAGWTLALLAVCVLVSMALAALRRARHQPPSRMAALMLPEARRDWVGFSVVCVLAGVIEEYVCRGFCLGLLTALLRSPAAAVALVSLSFGAGHLAQGRLGALRAAVLGTVLALPVLATGSLLPSIVAHAATDLLTPRWSSETRTAQGVSV